MKSLGSYFEGFSGIFKYILNTSADIWRNYDKIYFENPVAFDFLMYGSIVLSSLFILAFVLYRWRMPKKTFGSAYSYLGGLKLLLGFILVYCIVCLAATLPKISNTGHFLNEGPVEAVFLVGRSASEFAKDWGLGGPSRVELSGREIENLLKLGVFKKGDKAALFEFGAGFVPSMPLINIYGENDEAGDYDEIYREFIKETRFLFPPKSLKDYRGNFYWDSDIATALQHTYGTIDENEIGLRMLYGIQEKYKPERKDNRVLFLMSDGDFKLNPASDSTENEKKQIEASRQRLDVSIAELNKRGLRIYAVGVGTERGMPLASILDPYKLDQDYNQQTADDLKKAGVTRLNIGYLKSLVSRTGGDPNRDIFVLDNPKKSAVDFMRNAVDSRRTKEIVFVKSKQDRSLVRFLVLIAVLLMPVAYFLNGVKRLILWQVKRFRGRNKFQDGNDYSQLR